VAGAVRFVPEEHRGRYEEEFDAELDELVTAGLSQRAQVCHALRVALLVYPLRRALRAPVPGMERAR
jgi:hypothetical protein